MSLAGKNKSRNCVVVCDVCVYYLNNNTTHAMQTNISNSGSLRKKLSDAISVRNQLKAKFWQEIAFLVLILIYLCLSIALLLNTCISNIMQ